MARRAEEPEHFVLRIEWDSIEATTQGFRSSPQFGEFFAAVKPFFDQIEEMKHYQVRPPVATRRPAAPLLRSHLPGHALTHPTC